MPNEASLIAYCGLDCSGCPIHRATLEPDVSRRQTMRAEIAGMCTEHYGMNLRPADVSDCDGCRVESGRLFSGCAQCQIRRCAMEKKLSSCAFCLDYPCEALQNHFLVDPAAKARLESMRSSP